MTRKTAIGVWNDYEDTEVFTIEDLGQTIRHGWTDYEIDDFCDRRKSTNLTRFNYDPYTGEKIDWKEVKKLLNELIKNDKVS